MENQTVSTRNMKKAQKKVSPLLETNTENLVSDAQNSVQLILNSEKANKELNQRDADFVTHFVETGNAYKAAKLAAFSESVAKTQAHRWVKADISKNPKLHVFAAIYRLKHKAEQKAVAKVAHKISERIIDANFVKEKAVELIDKNNGDIPTHTTYHTDKDGVTHEKKHYAYNPTSVSKGIEMLGKHKDVKAFDNTIEHTTESSLTGLLANLAPTTKPPTLNRIDPGNVVDGEIIDDKSGQIPKPPSLLPNRPTTPEDD